VTLEDKRYRRKGIFAVDISDLKTKTIQRFKLPQKTDIKIFLEDGTEVEDDDYLESVPAHTLLVVSESSPKKRKAMTADNVFDHLLSLLRWNGVDPVYKEVVEFLKDDFSTKYKHISEKIIRDQLEANNTKLSTREEDPDWFQDLNTRAKTKEEVMLKNSQGRIRGYLYKAEAQLKQSDGFTSAQEQELIEDLLAKFRANLKKNNHHGELFHRAAEIKLRICDEEGLFKCQGSYAADNCAYSSTNKQTHEINPYSSREARILFSTWNLDHVIEKSRTIVPSIAEAVKIAAKSKNGTSRKQINENYFYSLLFTQTNLRLVHIVCHDKQPHKAKQCDRTRYFL